MNGPAKALNTHCGQLGSNQLKLRFIVSVQVKKKKKKKKKKRERPEAVVHSSFFRERKTTWLPGTSRWLDQPRRLSNHNKEWKPWLHEEKEMRGCPSCRLTWPRASLLRFFSRAWRRWFSRCLWKRSMLARLPVRALFQSLETREMLPKKKMKKICARKFSGWPRQITEFQNMNYSLSGWCPGKCGQHRVWKSWKKCTFPDRLVKDRRECAPSHRSNRA